MSAQPMSPVPPGPARLSPVWPFVFAVAAPAPWWFTIERHGFGMSIDAIGYVSTARSLLAGGGYYDCTQEPLSTWCPGLSTLLAGLGLVGVEPMVGAAIVNGLSFALIVGLAVEIL